jgi:putative glutamine amidotransferase
MPNLATWIRTCDDRWFDPIFARYPELRVWKADRVNLSLDEMDGLLLTGGPDVSQEFLNQEVPDPSLIQEGDPVRDRWEFAAVKHAVDRGLPILAICKGLQLFNVALGGTLKLHIANHNDPAMKEQNIQPLRNDRVATHRFDLVNSSHHQAIDRLADGCEVESWCATDDIIEQMRLRDHPYGLAVQYHPEKHPVYMPLFDDFFSRLTN